MDKHTQVGVGLCTGLALVLASATGAAADGGAGSDGRAGATGTACSVTSATVTATASPDPELTALFDSYADTGVGWTGADSTYTVPLRDGSVAWLFSDTFLGPVLADGGRPTTAPFLNNSVVVQAGTALTTVAGGTPEQPASLVGPDADADWYWFGAGDRTPRGDLRVGVLGFERFGDGYWDWGWSHNAIATIDTSTWQVDRVDPLPSAAGIQWASWYQRVGGTVYVYGVEDLGAAKYLHVAKVLGGDLTDLHRWRYWDGRSWVREESASVRVLPGVANELSVAPFHDGYLLVTQDTSVPFGSEVHAYLACDPQGPFVHAAHLFDMPEAGPAGTYADPNVFAYNAHEHPELREGDTLLVTYNVNSLDTSDLYGDVSIYRPRFVEVDLDVRLP